jgi:hypothetical protein
MGILLVFAAIVDIYVIVFTSTDIASNTLLANLPLIVKGVALAICVLCGFGFLAGQAWARALLIIYGVVMIGLFLYFGLAVLGLGKDSASEVLMSLMGLAFIVAVVSLFLPSVNNWFSA